MWTQSCAGTIVCGHNYVCAQSCVGTIVWVQSCLGTNVSRHNRVRSQACGHNRVGTTMYLHTMEYLIYGELSHIDSL